MMDVTRRFLRRGLMCALLVAFSLGPRAARSAESFVNRDDSAFKFRIVSLVDDAKAFGLVRPSQVSALAIRPSIVVSRTRRTSKGKLLAIVASSGGKRGRRVGSVDVVRARGPLDPHAGTVIERASLSPPPLILASLDLARELRETPRSIGLLDLAPIHRLSPEEPVKEPTHGVTKPLRKPVARKASVSESVVPILKKAEAPWRALGCGIAFLVVLIQVFVCRSQMRREKAMQHRQAFYRRVSH